MKFLITKANNGYIVKSSDIHISIMKEPYNANNLFVFRTLKEVFEWMEEQER